MPPPPSPPLPPATVHFLGLPRHYQDTTRHCGFACVTMALDFHKRGGKYQPGGPTNFGNGPQTGTISQLMMHLYTRGAGIWICSPKELRALWNEHAADVKPNKMGARELSGTAGLITEKVIDFIISNGTPSALALAYSATKKTHWVMAVGVSRVDNKTVGIFLADPWVPRGNFAYQCQPTCYEAGQGTETSARQAGLAHFSHTRGDACSCPNWNAGGTPSMDEVWKGCYDIPSVKKLISWGEIDNNCHAVIYGTKDEHDQNVNRPRWEPTPGDPVARVTMTDNLKDNGDGPEWRAFLEGIGFIDHQGVAAWHNLAAVGGATAWATVEVDGGTELIGFRPLDGAGVRLGLRFNSDNLLLGAARLRNWPNLRTPDTVRDEFLVNKDVWCQQSGVSLDLTGITATAEPNLLWRDCRQSAVPWWPFYVLNITPPPAPDATPGTPYKLYVDFSNRVYLALTDQELAGA